MDTLNILQWNAQSIVSNKYVLAKFLYDNDIHIAIISETWLKQTQNFQISKYNIVKNNCGNNHNGVAILIRDYIDFSIIPTYFDASLQNVCVQIKVNNTQITIISLYSPLNCSPAFDKNKLELLIKSVPSPLILAGDFNSHHTSWGCNSNSPRGNDVLDVIDDNNLVLLNDGNVTTLGTLSWRPNALDLTIVSPMLAFTSEWFVHDTPLGTSYHLPVMIKISLYNNNFNNTKCNNSHLPIYPKFKQVNWKKYREKVEILLENCNLTNCSALEGYNKFCNVLKVAVNQSTVSPFCTNSQNSSHHCTNKKFKKPTLVWWNHLCSEAVLNVKQAYVKLKQYPTEENYIEFKRLRALKKCIINRERKNSWITLCTSFNRCTSLSVIWKHMRKFNKSYTYNLYNDDSWVPDFLQRYTPDYTQEFSIPFNNPKLNSTNSYLLEPFTMQELISAISSRRDTAFGLDGIPYIMFKKMNNNSLILFLKIINLLWKYNTIPKEWKTDCLIPILKPNKQKGQADSYRPIALTSCVGKIFEQLIKQRLEFYIEHNGLLPNNQFGFRRGRSSRESLCQFHLEVQSSLSSNKILMAVFFDVASAFNNVNLSVLAGELNSLGIPYKVVSWIYSFLNDRKVFVKHNNHLYGPRFSYKGVCQGGILSPLMFILYIHRLNIILGTSVTNLQFADDLVVYTSGTNSKVVAKTITGALQNLKEYMNFLNLEINSSKTKVMVFGKKGTTQLPEIVYDGRNLSFATDVKFLGVLFTRNLSWQTYINKIVAKANKAVNILKSLTATYWGADPKILLILYKSLVRSHFEYGFLCFAQNQRILEKLNKIQNKCMRIITGAFKTSPIGALQIECNLPPLKPRFDYLKEIYSQITQ